MSHHFLLADDHPLFRAALASIVRSVSNDCEITEVDSYESANNALEQQVFTIAFVDLNMPGASGISDLALLKKMNPAVPVVVVSAHEEENVIRACMSNQASGYIIKSSPPEKIKQAIESLLAGDEVVPEGLDLSKYSELTSSETDKLATLTPSQLRVFTEIGKGKLNKQIAYDLGITEATVKAHITTIFKKLGINNRTQAVLLSQELQIKSPHLSLSS